jgi:non-heme chloroperoxidase
MALMGRSSAVKARARATPPRVAEGPFVTTRDDVSLFYQDFGSGPPIVFAAPWALGCDWWEYQTAALIAQGRRCITYDRRGQGRSGRPSAGYDFDTLADDLGTLLDTLDLGNVILVGHSMGSGEAVRYLSRHGRARVARLVLVAPITPLIIRTRENPDGLAPEFLEKVRAVLAKDRAGAIGGAAPAFFNAPTNHVSPEMMQWWAQMMLHCPLPVMLDLHRAFSETDFGPDLRKLSLPTLVIHGDHDSSAPLELTGRRTAQQIAGARLAIYEGAGHGLPITHMERLCREVLEFVAP